jgi:exonuclease III
MKFLSWNCQGLGNPKTVRVLKKLLINYSPDLVFLMETKLKTSELDVNRIKWGFKNCLAVDCRGSGRDRAGGLALLWMEEFSLTISSFSQNHIQALCDDEEDNEAWNLSAVYGYPEEHNKWRTW